MTEISNSWSAEIESQVYKWLLDWDLQRVMKLGRGQPASTTYQEILSHLWFYSSFRAIGLREMVDSAARVLGWVWAIDPGPLYPFSRSSCRQWISLCFVPASRDHSTSLFHKKYRED